MLAGRTLAFMTFAFVPGTGNHAPLVGCTNTSVPAMPTETGAAAGPVTTAEAALLRFAI
jgi:hypothetical protein